MGKIEGDPVTHEYYLESYNEDSEDEEPIDLIEFMDGVLPTQEFVLFVSRERLRWYALIAEKLRGI